MAGEELVEGAAEGAARRSARARSGSSRSARARARAQVWARSGVGRRRPEWAGRELRRLGGAWGAGRVPPGVDRAGRRAGSGRRCWWPAADGARRLRGARAVSLSGPVAAAPRGGGGGVGSPRGSPFAARGAPVAAEHRQAVTGRSETSVLSLLCLKYPGCCWPCTV